MNSNYDALNLIGDRALETAREKGFTVNEQGAEIDRKLLLIVREIGEAHEELRDGRGTNEIYFGSDGKPEGFPIEMADAIVRILQLCRSQQIDIGAAVKMKMDFNDTRPYKHGRQF